MGLALGGLCGGPNGGGIGLGAGERELECALVRTKSYVLAVPNVVAPGVFNYMHWNKEANEVHLNERPDPRVLRGGALRAAILRGVHPDTSRWRAKVQLDWYRLEIDALNAASRVLQHFNHLPDAQKPVADQLAELRAMARSVAELISKSPSVHRSYFVGDRFVTRDELIYTIDNAEVL